MSEGAPRWQVTVTYPNGEHRSRGTSAPSFYVGSGPGNDLHLPHDYVAARHLRLELVGDGFRVTDLGSGGRTLLHGEPLSTDRPQWLGEGDRLGIGPLRLAVERIYDAEIVDAGFEAASQGSLAVAPARSPAPAVPVIVPAGDAAPESGARTLPSPRQDFRNFRPSRLTGGLTAVSPPPTRLPRLLGWIAAAVLFSAAVALVVLVVL